MKRILAAIIILLSFALQSCVADDESVIRMERVLVARHVYIGKIHYISFENGGVINYTQDSIDHEEYLKYENDSTFSVVDHDPMDYLLVHKQLRDRDAHGALKK